VRVLLLFLLGCATSTQASEEDPRPEAPPSAATCADDEHACGETCMTELANEPANGCAFGCNAACPAPANAIATCSIEGTCDFRCPTGFARVGQACVAEVCEQKGYTCGAFVDDTGAVFDCGGCIAGSQCGANHQCAIAPDSREENDTVAHAKSLGDLDDAYDPVQWIDNLSIDASADEDWFRFHLTDGFDGGNPLATIELRDRESSQGWLESQHELTVWFKCDTQELLSSVRCGEWYSEKSANTLLDPQLGVGCTVDATYVVWADVAPSCAGATDSGTVTFRIRKHTVPRGDLYDLRVSVE
jgi:hypothetical protein